MTRGNQTMESTAQAYARTAGQAYGDAAAYLRTLPETDWSGPTGCAEWDVRTLAGHIAGEAVWFVNLAGGVTRREAPLPDEVYEEMKILPPAALADRVETTAHAIAPIIDEASLAQLQQDVDMGWTTLPLWRATYVAATEAVYHDWDLHVGRDPAATIPTAWAQTLATGTARFAPMIANMEGIVAAPGRYLLVVGDGVGPVTLTAQDGRLSVELGESGAADAVLRLTADQYVRLAAGRLPLERAMDEGTISAGGDRGRLLGLTRIFRGIGMGQ